MHGGSVGEFGRLVGSGFGRGSKGSSVRGDASSATSKIKEFKGLEVSTQNNYIELRRLIMLKTV